MPSVSNENAGAPPIAAMSLKLTARALCPRKSWRRVFELEINIFDQQVDGDERFAPIPLAQDGGVVADSQDQVSRARFRRLIANAFYEVELALHLSG